MTVWILDLDGVVQELTYPFERMLHEMSTAVGLNYQTLLDHYQTKFSGVKGELAYHLSLCPRSSDQASVRKHWRWFDEKKLSARVLPGAVEFLEEVQSRGNPVFAWTKGDLETQRQRLTHLGLIKYFGNRIIFSPRKGTTVGVVKDLLPQLPAGNKVLVGDSWEQDIYPAVGQTEIALYWVTDQENPGLILPSGVYKISGLGELHQLLLEGKVIS